MKYIVFFIISLTIWSCTDQNREKNILEELKSKNRDELQKASYILINSQMNISERGNKPMEKELFDKVKALKNEVDNFIATPPERNEQFNGIFSQFDTIVAVYKKYKLISLDDSVYSKSKVLSRFNDFNYTRKDSINRELYALSINQAYARILQCLKQGIAGTSCHFCMLNLNYEFNVTPVNGLFKYEFIITPEDNTWYDPESIKYENWSCRNRQNEPIEDLEVNNIGNGVYLSFISSQKKPIILSSDIYYLPSSDAILKEEYKSFCPFQVSLLTSE